MHAPVNWEEIRQTRENIMRCARARNTLKAYNHG